MKTIFALAALALTAYSAPAPGQEVPVGTILAWTGSNEESLPAGWELCNGQMINDAESPFNGQTLPPLNTENLFLRGAGDNEKAGQVQGSALPQHGHASQGHTHMDRGHTHEDAGHTHDINLDRMNVLTKGITWGDSDGDPKFAVEGQWSKDSKVVDGRANIVNGHALLSEGHVQVSNPTDAMTDKDETRPKNVRFPFIIKVKSVSTLNVQAPAGVVVATIPTNQDKTTFWKQMTLLNEVELFLRGGVIAEAGQVQHDAIQVHAHNEAGHTHKDLGHTHADRGHTHDFVDKDGKAIFLLMPGSNWGDRDGNPTFAQTRDVTKQISKGFADIQEAHADIMEDREIIGEATGVKTGDETRPKNMRVNYQEATAPLVNLESFPVGTILPLIAADEALPTGWFKCDGKTEGVPDLRQRYLRGGPAALAGQMEEAQIKAHSHDDLGHTHSDAGHLHKDAGHINRRNILIPGNQYGDGDGNPQFATSTNVNIPKGLGMAKADLMESFVNLEETKAVIGDVTKAEAADELRLKNVAVDFIMRKF